MKGTSKVGQHAERYHPEIQITVTKNRKSKQKNASDTSTGYSSGPATSSAQSTAEYSSAGYSSDEPADQISPSTSQAKAEDDVPVEKHEDDAQMGWQKVSHGRMKIKKGSI